MRTITIFFLMMFGISYTLGNTKNYENIEYGKKVSKADSQNIVGQIKDKTVYAKIEKDSYKLYMQKGLRLTLYIDDASKIDLQRGNIIYGVSVYNDNILITGILQRDSITVDTEYQDVWIENDGQTFKLRHSNYNVDDKPLNVSFFDKGQKVVCYNVFVPPYGYDEEDKYIDIFDIQNLSDIKKKTIEIEHCVDFEIVDNDYVYCVEYVTPFEGAEDYSFAICKSPSDNLSKVDTISKGTQLLSISADGKYILAKKELYGKSKFVIIDVFKKKCAYLLDDKYIYKQAYFDPEKKQFFLDSGESYIYLIMPKEFSHDALDYFPTNKFENEKFWGNEIK